MSDTNPIETLDKRLKAADVRVVNEAEGIYEVFVPGAIRETTRVKAESEEEAIEKTRAALVTKLEHNAKKPAPTGESDGELKVDSMKQGTTTTDIQEEA